MFLGIGRSKAPTTPVSDANMLSVSATDQLAKLQLMYAEQTRFIHDQAAARTHQWNSGALLVTVASLNLGLNAEVSLAFGAIANIITAFAAAIIGLISMRFASRPEFNYDIFMGYAKFDLEDQEAFLERVMSQRQEILENSEPKIAKNIALLERGYFALALSFVPLFIG